MIQIQNLLFSYKGSEPLFSGFDFHLESGGICGLLGKNGAGKTTLLKLLCGLLFPKSGLCEVKGFSPEERLPQFLQDTVFIPEEFYVPAMTGDQYIKCFAPFYQKFDLTSFLSGLNEFELDKSQLLSEMSYGQKKKFIIAFGIATNANLLLLDEPTNGLDIPSKSQFRKLLARAISPEKTFIISTHQVRDVEHLIDPIVILDRGKIILNQSVESLMEHLSFELTDDLKTAEGSLYFEKTLNGYQIVAANRQAHDSKLELELLFNAAVLNQNRINDLFKGSNHG